MLYVKIVLGYNVIQFTYYTQYTYNCYRMNMNIDFMDNIIFNE